MDTEVGKCWEVAKTNKKDRILCITVMHVEMRVFELWQRGTENNLKSGAFIYFF